MPAIARSILSEKIPGEVWRTVASCGAVPLFQLHVTKRCRSRKCMLVIASIINKYFTFYFDSHLQRLPSILLRV